MAVINESKTKWLKEKIRDIPDFPKPGIMFRDLSTLFKDGEAFACVIDLLSEEAKSLSHIKLQVLKQGDLLSVRR